MNTRDELLELLGQAVAGNQAIRWLESALNDCWCEDHMGELSPGQMAIAMEMEAWAKRSAEEGAALIVRARKELEAKR